MNEWFLDITDHIFKDIVKTYYGTILVVDENGKLIYGRKPPESKIQIDGSSLLGKTIYDIENEGIFTNTATAEALKTGTRSVRLVNGSTGTPLLAIATPIKTNEGSVKMVVTFSQDEEMTLYIIKRFQEERDKLAQLTSYLLQKPGKSTIIYESEKIEEVIHKLDKGARTDVTILLCGESGTGKEVFSRYVHKTSHRKEAPFIPVNCSAIPEELMESELFGYAKGAFTGANREGKVGLFELAENGTLFLDEIGELSLPAQSKLLRALETGEIQKIGSEKVTHTHTRIVAATNRDLLQLINEGKFRKDLYYRLNVFPVIIPPVRERVEDIAPLAEFFLREFNKKYGLSKILHFTTIDVMKQYSWPGNVREIKNVIERIVISSSSDVIMPTDLAQIGIGISNQIADTSLLVKKINLPEDIKPLKDVLHAFEEDYILQAIALCSGNVAEASSKLCMHKSGIYKKLDEYKKSKIE